MENPANENNLPLVPSCPNFRDVGAFVNVIAEVNLMHEHRLYRGGRLDPGITRQAVGSPGTIINLRNSADLVGLGADVHAFPASDEREKYETSRPEVRRWLGQVIRVFETPNLRYPVLVHCTGGRDRTGIVVAALLRLLGIPDDVIVREYLLSDGDVREERIREALAGIGEPVKYFRRTDLERVRSDLLQS